MGTQLQSRLIFKKEWGLRHHLCYQPEPNSSGGREEPAGGETSHLQRGPHATSQHVALVCTCRSPTPCRGPQDKASPGQEASTSETRSTAAVLPGPQDSQQATYQPRTWRLCQKWSLSWFPRHSLGANSIDLGHTVWKPSDGWRWPGHLGYSKPKTYSHTFCKWEERLKQWRHLSSSLVRPDGQD